MTGDIYKRDFWGAGNALYFVLGGGYLDVVTL